MDSLEKARLRFQKCEKD